MDEKNALMAEYGLTAEMLDFSLEDYTIDELREKFESMKSAGAEGVQPPEGPDNFALESQICDELVKALESDTIERGDDEWRYRVPRYWFLDYDKDLMEVYGTSSEDFNIYGFTYSMDGDHAVIDWDSKKRMKLSLVPYDEGTQVSQLGRMFAQVEDLYSADRADLAAKYQAEADTVASMKSELSSLRQFKQDTENAAASSAREEVFEQFEDLNGVEAFEALRENCAEFSAEELEEKCFAIRGRQGVQVKFSHEPKAPKLPVEPTQLKKEPYGGIFSKYGFVSSNPNA